MNGNKHHNHKHNHKEGRPDRQEQRPLSQEWRKSLPTPEPAAHASGGKREMWRAVVAAVVGLLVGLGIGLLVGGRDAAAPTGEESDGEAAVIDEGAAFDVELAPGADPSGRVPLEVAASPEEEILVKDQDAGDSVFITRVGLSLPGWVAIHEDAGGEPGNVLGAKRFDGGVFQGVVLLLRDTEAGRTYHAVLWRDDGDKEFNIDSDSIVAGIRAAFEAY